MSNEEALETLKYEVYEEGHCSYIEQELDLAIKALEKQIPKKVLKEKIPKTSFGMAGTIHKCPSCGELLYADWKFCFECGQALDWSEEE